MRTISTDDLAFLIRHDKAKLARLRTFLYWKDVRKNTKDSDDKGGDVDFVVGDDALSGAGVIGSAEAGDAAKKNKKQKLRLPWDVASFYSEQVPERDDEEDEEEEEINYATLERLKDADERTKNMTKEEYLFWSECRQVSFTRRNRKKFRDWAGVGVVTDGKPNDDVVDVLGFLASEVVQTLTDEAHKIKEAERIHKMGNGAAEDGASKKRKLESGLFDPPEEGRTPIGPRHVQEAFRRLQRVGTKSRAMRNYGGSALHRSPLKLVVSSRRTCSVHANNAMQF